MNQRVLFGSNSGTCNVCSAPCSSCMHRNLVHMGSKGNESSDESCHENASSQYSIYEGDVLPLVKSRECENQQQAASETSNQVSVNSSHDSFTQNAGSKAFMKSSNISDPSKDVVMLQKLISSATVAKDQPSENPQCDFDQKASCIGVSKGAESQDDHTSCVSTSKISSVVDSPKRNANLKNLSCSSISVGSKAATASLDEHSSEKYICGDSVAPGGSGGYAGNSIQKVPPSLSVDISSPKLESPETTSQENVDAVANSLKFQALNSHRQRHSSPCYSNVKGLEENASLQPLEKLPESLAEHVNSSAEDTGPDIAFGQKFAACEDSKNGMIREGSKVTTEISRKSGLENDKEIGDQLDATFTSSDKTEHVKSEELAELPRLQDSPLESPSEDETGDSDVVEQDVKVCDICGDAGREDLLAVCSRCSDGAEHIYCMREMLKKVPEGEWLCEECKFADEFENRNQGEPDGESGNASSQSSGHSITELSLKLDLKGVKTDAKATSKVSSSPRVSGKRTAENNEVGSTVKRQALEASIGSPKPSPRVSALSRDSSFKSLEKGKVRPAHQTSNGTLSGNDFAESARSPSNGPRPQMSKGTLLKSNSFSTVSSKPKVKLVDDVSLKQKGAREHASLGMKDGAVRMMGKSMSFKSTNSVCPNPTESKVKLFSPKISQDPDFKGLKHTKDRNTFEKKILSKLDRPLASSTKISSAASTPKGYHKLTSRGESSFSPISSNRDLKVAQSDGKLTSLSRSTSNLGRKGTETIGVSGGVSSAEQKSNQLSLKEEPSSSSSTAERPSSNANGGLQDGFPRLRESTSQAEKTRESFSSRSRQIATTGLRMVACPKCKEVGHDAESCTVASPRASGVDVSAARSSREEMKEGNKLKAAITAAMLKKPGIYKKKLTNVKGEELSVSNADLNVELASQDKSLVPSTMRNTMSAEGVHDGQAVLKSNTLDSYKPIVVNNMEQPASNPREAADSFKVEDANCIFASDGKPTMREVSSYVSAAMKVCKAIAIPEHEYIWQGNFELHRGKKQPELCAGIQAHVSTSASRKVIEVMNNFPHNVSLSEVPRLSTWPQQFHESGAKEENIALYFFAKDLESYQRNYKWLVECMMKNDLALKGNLDGVELLVFPSNQLPEKSQRWNMLFFLWGVFRGKKVNGSDHLSGSSIKLDTPSLNIPPVGKDIPATVMSFSENHSSPKDESLSSCDISFDRVLASDPPSAGNANGDCNTKSEPVDKKCLRTSAVSEQQHSALESQSLPKVQTSNSVSGQETRCTDIPLVKEASSLDCKWNVDLQPFVRSFGATSVYNEGEKAAMQWDTSLEQKIASCSDKILPVCDLDVNDGSFGEKKKVDVMDCKKDAVKLEVDLMEVPKSRETSVETDQTRNEELSNWQFSRKRPHFDLVGTPLQASTATSQNLPWNSTGNTLAAGEGQIKKLKAGIGGGFKYDSSRDEISRSDDHTSEIHDIPPCSSTTDKGYERPSDKKVILEDPGTERFFFPVASYNGKDLLLRENSIPWKMPKSEFQDKVPNLELALGGDIKPANKGFLPFFAGMADKQSNQGGDLPDKSVGKEEEEEDVSASLSLSLSFPFPDEEETAKPTPKTEQLLPDNRPRVNTSLLLFGGFPEK